MIDEKNDGDPIYFDLNKSYRGYTDRKLFEQAKQDASWSYKLEKASALLNEHIQGELVIFAIQPDGYSEYCHTFEHIGPGEYRHFSYHSLLDFVGVEEKEYQQTREVSMDTILVSGNILKKYAKKGRKTLICWAKPGWIE